MILGDQGADIIKVEAPDGGDATRAGGNRRAAFTASQAITAALLARERSGEGQHVRLSMLEAVIAFLWASDMGSQTFVGDEPARQEAATALDLIYETADGYMTVAPLTDRHWAGLAKAAGR